MTAREKISANGLSALFVLLAVVLLLVERAPPIVACLVVLTATFGASLTTAKMHLRSRYLFWCAAALVLWILISASWSIAEGEAVSSAIRIAAMMLVATLIPLLVMSQPGPVQTRVGGWALAAAGLAVTLLVIETVLDMPLLRLARYVFNGEVFVSPVPYPRGPADGITYVDELYLKNRLSHLASVVAILALPLSVLMWKRYGVLVAVLSFVAAGVAVYVAPTHAPLAAIAASLLVSVFLIAMGGAAQRFTQVLAVLLAVCVVLSPWLAQGALDLSRDILISTDASALHRLAIWDYVAELIIQQPLLGYGIEASRVFGRGGAELTDLVPHDPVVFEALPLHPHNASLQVWLELGLVGALILATMVYLTTRSVMVVSEDPVIRASVMGAWVATLVVMHLSYGIWQFWWIATLGMLPAMLMLMMKRDG